MESQGKVLHIRRRTLIFALIIFVEFCSVALPCMTYYSLASEEYSEEAYTEDYTDDGEYGSDDDTADDDTADDDGSEDYIYDDDQTDDGLFYEDDSDDSGEDYADGEEYVDEDTDEETEEDTEDSVYTIKKLGGEIHIDSSEAGDISTVKSYLDTGIDATVSGSPEDSAYTEEWYGVDAEVEWDSSPVGYDKSKKGGYSFTWSGTVKKGSAIYNSDEGKEATALSDIKLTVKFVVDDDGSVSGDSILDKLDTSLIAWDKNQGDVEAEAADLDTELAKQILTYQMDLDKEKSEAIEGAVEGGNKITLSFNAKYNEDSVSTDEKSKMKEEALAHYEDADVGGFFDLSLSMNIEGDAKAYDISDTGDDNPLFITIKVPESMQRPSRTYNIVRYHDDKAELLNGSFEQLGDNGELSFESSRFSDYAIAFVDADVSSEVAYEEDSEEDYVDEDAAVGIEEYDEEDMDEAADDEGDFDPDSGSLLPLTDTALVVGRIIYVLYLVSIIAVCSFILIKDVRRQKNKSVLT